jgi:murein DD-endopeptidase MepM/ murein hydrolase activator NlpD
MSTHTIAPGDTFWGLAERYGSSVEAIMVANPGIAPEQLQVGQVIRLPGGQSSTGNTSSNGRSDTTLNGRVPGWLESLRDMINAASQKTNVPADLIAAVIYQESNGNVNVVSTLNPNGGDDSSVMQVNQHTAGELLGKYPDRFQGTIGTARDIMLGVSYLRDMYDTVGDRNWGITLRAYNSGPYGVDKTNLRATPASTGDPAYVDKVLHFWSDITQGKDPPADHYASIYE